MSALAANAQAVKTFVNTPGLEHAGIGISIKEVETGKVVAEYQPKASRIPASVTKLVTTASALEMLSDTFRFETRLTTNGDIVDSTLFGDIFIVGGGDPTLESDFYAHTGLFKTLTDTIKSLGIKKIEGRIIGDGSLYVQSGVPGEWLVEDVDTYYGQTPSALSFNDNLLFLTYTVDSTNTPQLEAVMPRNRLLEVEDKLKVGTNNNMWWRVHGDSHQWHKLIRGRIPANKKTLVKMENPDPGLMIADSLAFLLEKDSIGHCGIGSSMWTADTANNDTCLYVHRSLPLSQIIKTTNHQSVNLFAENIFLYLGTQKTIPSSHESAVKVVEHYWDSLKISNNKIHQVDGSGLSMKNAICPEFLTDMLIYMKKGSKYSNTFVKSLPTCGVNGTVEGFLAGTALKGKVLAKSGSMERVQNYSGYIIWKKKWYAFTIMVNNFDCTRADLRKHIGTMMLSVMKAQQ